MHLKLVYISPMFNLVLKKSAKKILNVFQLSNNAQAVMLIANTIPIWYFKTIVE